MNYCFCKNCSTNVLEQMTHQHSLCKTIAHIVHIKFWSFCLDMSRACIRDRCSTAISIGPIDLIIGKWRELYQDFCFFEKAENLLSFRQVAKEMLPHLALVNFEYCFEGSSTANAIANITQSFVPLRCWSGGTCTMRWGGTTSTLSSEVSESAGQLDLTSSSTYIDRHSAWEGGSIFPKGYRWGYRIS